MRIPPGFPPLQIFLTLKLVHIAYCLIARINQFPGFLTLVLVPMQFSASGLLFQEVVSLCIQFWVQ